MNESVADKIHRIRLEKKLRNGEIAELVGVRGSRLSSWKSIPPRGMTLLALHAKLDAILAATSREKQAGS